jgi:hypothetical protein
MRWDAFSRRHVLQGLGASLVLPFLPSIARAQSAPVQKTFIGVAAFNGLYRMYGPNSVLMPKTPYDKTSYDTLGFTAMPANGRHVTHACSLATIAAGNGGKISDLIDASFTPYLPKMNMMQGFDYVGLGYFHHHGQFGNHGASAGDSGNPEMATIERVLSYAPQFYKNSALKGRAISWSANSSEGMSGYEASFTFQDPNNPTTSAIVSSGPTYSNPATLWDQFFGASQASVPLKKTLVDRVLADYKSLRSSDARLGGEDRRRLDLHVQLLQDTQARVNAVAGVCNELRPATNLSDRKLILTTMNDVISALVACGLCHSFLGWAQSIVSSNPENYHTWSHEGYENDNNTDGFVDRIANSTSYTSLVEHNRSIMRDMCLDLVTKLDAHGVLDNTLLACIQEHNRRGHESWNVPIITFGGAGGAIKTGQYLDYRDMANRDDRIYSRFGFPINQFLANAMMAMDVPPSQFEPLNKGSSSLFKAGSGYGVARFNPQDGGVFDDHYDAHWQGHDMSGWLPGLV